MAAAWPKKAITCNLTVVSSPDEQQPGLDKWEENKNVKRILKTNPHSQHRVHGAYWLDRSPPTTREALVCTGENETGCGPWVAMCETSKGYRRQGLEQRSSSVTCEALLQK